MNDDLLDRFLAGELPDASDQRELAQRLHTDPALRRRAGALLRLDGALLHRFRIVPQPRVRTRRWPYALAAVAAAAAVVAAWMLWQEPLPPTVPQPPAVIAEAPLAAAGMHLVTQQAAVIWRLPGGGTLRLEPDSAVSVIHEQPDLFLALDGGQATLAVPGTTLGCILALPQMEVHGRDMSLQASTDGRTSELHIRSGEAELLVICRDSRSTLRVRPGTRLRLTEHGSWLVPDGAGGWRGMTKAEQNQAVWDPEGRQ